MTERFDVDVTVTVTVDVVDERRARDVAFNEVTAQLDIDDYGHHDEIVMIDVAGEDEKLVVRPRRSEHERVLSVRGQVQAVADRQGWDDHTLADLLLHYALNHVREPFENGIVGYLDDVARRENKGGGVMILTTDQLNERMRLAKREGRPIDGDAAQTIASWWYSPNDTALVKAAMGHSSELSYDELGAISGIDARAWADESDDPNGNYRDLVALRAWASDAIKRRDLGESER